MDDIKRIVSHFQMAGTVSEAAPYGSGHINTTWRLRIEQGGQSRCYILQRINAAVFRQPAQVMDTMARVTGHIRAKLQAAGVRDVDRRVLTLVPAVDGKAYYCDAEGHTWRAMPYIEGTQTVDTPQTPAQAFEAARAFGRFQKDLADLPGSRLAETIPDFHHTPKRLEAFLQVLREDPYNRAAQAAAEIDFVLNHAPLCDVLINLLQHGAIPERITHNDTKINNVLFDRRTQEGICVIDLDTVMPGLSLYDFGDLVRTAACAAAEDERDVSKVGVDIALFEQVLRGYTLEAAAFLTQTEWRHLVVAAQLITFEQMIRFLCDYLNGDLYYKTHRPGQNLDRAKTQQKLVQSIHRQEDRMNELTDTVRRHLGI